MKKFVQRLFYLLLPLFLLSYPLDLIFSNILKKSHDAPGEHEVWNDIYNANAGYDIAIYGSSRAWVQIDSEIMATALNKKVYNFGIDGHNFWLQYLRHLEYIKYNNKKPHRIILNVDAFTLQKREDLYNDEQFLPYLLWDKNIRHYTSSYKGFSIADYYIPFLRYGGRNKVLKKVVNHIIKNKSDTISYRNKGYKGFDRKWDKSIDSLFASGEKYYIKFHKETLNLFEQFIKECLNDNITITLVYAPEYVDGQNYVANREDAMIYFRKISRKYELTFLDYSKNELSYRKELFYNANHLNKEGSELFTRKLIKDLQY